MPDIGEVWWCSIPEAELEGFNRACHPLRLTSRFPVCVVEVRGGDPPQIDAGVIGADMVIRILAGWLTERFVDDDSVWSWLVQQHSCPPPPPGEVLAQFTKPQKYEY
jgi:hypothetical protein